MSLRAVILGIMALLVASACVPEVSPTPIIEREPSLEPSATFWPYVPTESDDASIGRSDPTSAALAGEGEPSLEPEDEPIFPTMAAFPLQFFARDNFLLRVMFYGAETKPAPSVLLLHDTGEDGDAWLLLGPALQAAGYNVFAPDLRDSQQPEDAIDWALVLDDLAIIVEEILAMDGVATDRMVWMGAGTGANVALALCGEFASCMGIVALSPREMLPGLEVVTPPGEPLLAISADDDLEGTQQAERIGSGEGWVRYPTGGRGTTLLRTQADLIPRLVGWVQQVGP